MHDLFSKQIHTMLVNIFILKQSSFFHSSIFHFDQCVCYAFFNNSHLFEKKIFLSEKSTSRFSLRLRFGVTNLKSTPRHLSVERSIAEIFVHPKYKPKTFHYAVGTAVTGWSTFVFANAIEKTLKRNKSKKSMLEQKLNLKK